MIFGLANAVRRILEKIIVVPIILQPVGSKFGRLGGPFTGQGGEITATEKLSE